MHTHLTFEKAVSDSTYAKIVELLLGLGVSVKVEKDDTKMSKEAYFKMIDEARAGKKHKMSMEDMQKMLLG